MKVFNNNLNYSRIKELREVNNISQNDMAIYLGISRATYTQFENMKRAVFPTKKINLIANYFNVSIDYLLNFNDTKNYVITNLDINWKLSGLRIKEIRKENKLYQSTLEEELGLSYSYLSKVENGKRLINIEYLYAICNKYNVSADYLLGRTDEPKYLK